MNSSICRMYSKMNIIYSFLDYFYTFACIAMNLGLILEMRLLCHGGAALIALSVIGWMVCYAKRKDIEKFNGVKVAWELAFAVVFFYIYASTPFLFQK